MHVILTSVGTDGDIYPYVGLGSRLRSRGHEVTLCVSSHYEHLSNANGLSFVPLITAEENRELFDHPDFWHPRKTGPLSAKWGLQYLERQYHVLSKLVQDDTVIVSNPGVFAAAMVCERYGCPSVSLLLQPWLIPSTVKPPLMPGLGFLRRAPRFVWKIFWRLLDSYGDRLIGGEMNRFRASLELKPINRVFSNWLSPQLVIGMFPDWFASPQADWPDQIKLAGFPLTDGRASLELPEVVNDFCRSGPPPVAFTFGTGMRHSASLFHLATAAVTASKRRAIFLTKHADQLPGPLAPHILHCPFASFDRLFPLCSAVVHHGGIGTASHCMQAGVPQLILPICFDQTDNGDRIRSLGIGTWLKKRHQTPSSIAAALDHIGSPATRQRCAAIQQMIACDNGLDHAVRQIETLHQSQISSTAASDGAVSA